MTTYRAILTLFIICILLLITSGLQHPLWLWVIATLAVLCIAFIFAGTKIISLNFFLESISRGPKNEKAIALTFDDGPDTYTEDILSILKSYDVQAAFFCVGSKALKKPQTLKKIHREGHLIGNHSYSHSFGFDFSSSKTMAIEIETTNLIIEKLTSARTHFFRPPYGVTNPPLSRAVKKTNMMSIGWTVRSGDTFIKSRSKILKRLKRGLKPGAIFLFHDSKKAAVDVLPSFIDYVYQNNYSIKRLDNLISNAP